MIDIIQPNLHSTFVLQYIGNAMLCFTQWITNVHKTDEY